jgi:hypothetical protein
MSNDIEGEDMAIFARFNKRPSATLTGRRTRETRPLARADRLKLTTPSTKSRQMNLKVTPEFYERVTALARNAKVPMVEIVERAVEAYAHRENEDA